MTVETQVAKVIAGGNGSATSFSFSPMVIEDEDELVVILRGSDDDETTLTRGTGTDQYTVVVSEFPGTGSITYPSSGTGVLATGTSLAMVRRKTLEQTTDLDNQSPYLPDTLELQLDRLLMIDQQQQEQIDRAVKIPVSFDDDFSLSTDAPSAGKILQVNDDGDGLTWVSLSTSVLAVSSYIETLLNDADAATARATLGLVIGTNVQAQDAELAALAGLTSAADRLPYFTGLGTASLATFTAAGRAIVDDADAAAQRVTIGLDANTLFTARALFAASDSSGQANVTGDNTTAAFTFATEHFDIGSNFVHTTGIFTAPVTGRYLFTGVAAVTGVSGHSGYGFELFVNGATQTWSQGAIGAMADASGTLILSFARIVSLTAGHTVLLRGTVGGAAKVIDHLASARFEGYFLG